MGLETVVQEIQDQGVKEERTLLAQAEAERAKILDQARAQADDWRARRLAETRVKVDALRREVQSASEFEARRRRLIARRELTDDFRRRVLRAIADLPRTDNEASLAALLRNAKKTLPKGTVHARAADLALLAKGGYDKGGELPGIGGFQVESADGTILLDYRYETLLENAWKDVLGATQKLFEG